VVGFVIVFSVSSVSSWAYRNIQSHMVPTMVNMATAHFASSLIVFSVVCLHAPEEPELAHGGIC